MKIKGLFFVCLSALLGLPSMTGKIFFFERQTALASPELLYVAPNGNCNGVGPCYSTVQAAMDAAKPGDEIRIAAGVYTDTNHYGGLVQVVYVTKTVTLRGGYSVTNWDIADPDTNLTTLDAQGRGRVVFISGEISPTIEGIRMTGGDAAGLGGHKVIIVDDAGGGVYAITATVTLSNSHVFSNSATFGGGAYFLSGGVILQENTWFSNTADIGGGFYARFTEGYVQENMISSNSAGNGGGLALDESSVLLYRNSIVSDTVEGVGGGLYSHKSDITLDENYIAANEAESGGGLFLSDSGATLRGNDIFSNYASRFGGGLYLENGTVSLIANLIANNTSPEVGGGVYLIGGSATLRNNTIEWNRANDFGGGIFVEGGNATIEGNTVISNTAGWGGGISLFVIDATVSGNIIANNTGEKGGGLYLWQSNSSLTNNVVSDNRCDVAGSSLFIEGSSPKLVYTTIARNAGGDGSGIYLERHGWTYSSVVLTNTILVSHTVGITVPTGHNVKIDGILWFENGADADGDGVIMVSHATTGNPAFAVDGYHLTANSAAINAGIAIQNSIDIDYEPRPYEGYDLGADEYWPPGALKRFYLPLVLR